MLFENNIPLPIGWQRLSLSEITVSMKNGIYKPPEFYIDDGIACLRMYNIEGGNIIWKDIKRMQLSLDEIEEYRLLPGDILVNRVNSRELVGKSAVIPNGMEPCVYESKNIRLRVKNANPRFVNFWFLHFSQSYFSKNAQQVVGMASINQKQLAAMPIPLPSLDVQDKIVDKVDELFSQIDAGVASLRSLQQRLKRYKASVLKAACEGRLAAQQPGDEPAAALLRRLGKQPLEADGLGKLPVGWCWTKVSDLGVVSGGLTKNSKRNNLHHKMPYLRVANVYANELRLDEIAEIGVNENEIDRVLLKDGDLLVVEGNGSPDQIGRVAIWRDEINPCLHQNHIIKVRFSLKALAQYVLYWLLSEGGRNQITSVASSTSGLYTLSLSKVSSLLIPLPPFEEQARIVEEIERRLSVAAAVEQAAAAGLRRAGRLRQAVLKAAFEGRLG